LDWVDAWGGHPSVAEARKVADMLIAFCKTDPTATPWFLRPEPRGRPPVIAKAAASSTGGPAPLKVDFQAEADDADGEVLEYFWSFDDGTFGFDGSNLANTRNVRSPSKTFMTPGRYTVRLTVIDNQGNSTFAELPITIGAPGGD
jgi:PKD repeat protein